MKKAERLDAIYAISMVNQVVEWEKPEGR